MTPYEQGYEVGRAGKPGPAFPSPSSSWSERLYNRGWSAGVDDRLKVIALEKMHPRAFLESSLSVEAVRWRELTAPNRADALAAKAP